MALRSLSIYSLSLCSLAATVSFSQTVHADNFKASQEAAIVQLEQQDENTEAKEWRVVLGGGAFVMPEYQGSDEYEFLPLPYFDITYKDRVRLNIEGLDVKVLNNKQFNAGIGVGADFGRDDDDGDRLRGLGDIDPAAEGRLFAEYTPGRASAKVVYSQDLGFGDGHDGFLIEADAGYLFILSDTGTFIRPSVGTSFGSEDYNQSYFGVTSAQAGRSSLSRFETDAGFVDVNTGVFVTQKLTKNWSVNGLLQYSRLVGDAADSPVVEDENQFQTGLFVAYTF